MKSTETKKILVITEVFLPEEFLINDLVYFWKNQGRSVSVITRNPSYPYGRIFPGYKNHLFQQENIDGVQVYRVQFIPGYNNNQMLKILNYFWNMFLGCVLALKIGKKYDTIFIYQTGPLTFSSIGILIKIIYKKPAIIWSQDIWPETVYAYGIAKRGLFKIILERFVKWVYSNCDHITVTSPGFIKAVNRYCPLKDVRFIPQWSLTPKPGEITPSNLQVDYPGKFNFVFAGNIGKAQNLKNVILGFEQYILEYPRNDVWLNIVGDGSNLKSLQHIVNTKSIQNIKFWGRLNISNMPVMFERADVLVISLENKQIFNITIPAKFQSYLNAEKPILGILSGEVKDLINLYNIGWTADPDDIIAIKNQITNIVTNYNSEVDSIIKNTKLINNSHFNREKIINEFTEIVYGN
jgi:glycosyltransferase involved in cell wall biosynthesis